MKTFSEAARALGAPLDASCQLQTRIEVTYLFVKMNAYT